MLSDWFQNLVRSIVGIFQWEKKPFLSAGEYYFNISRLKLNCYFLFSRNHEDYFLKYSFIMLVRVDCIKNIFFLM